MRHHRARHVEHAADIGVEHRAHVVVLERRKLIVADDAGVVDQDVDAPAAIGDALDRGGRRGRVAHVEALGRDLAPVCLRCLHDVIGRLRIVAVEKCDIAAFVGE